jgi:endonuclease YncB( thermonuclease family)
MASASGSTASTRSKAHNAVINQGPRPWRCGQQAALALADLIGRHPVRCEERGTDRYHRIIAVCFLKETNINQWMVRQGWALAYRQCGMAYVADEQQAQAAKKGIWIGTFA